MILAGGGICSVLEVDSSGHSTCLSAGLPVLSIAAATVVGEALYVLGSSAEDSTTEQLWSYTNSTWKETWSGTNDVASIVTGGSTVIGFGTNQAWQFDPSTGARTALSGTPSAQYESAWANSTTDVFLGDNQGGIAHYNGASWKTTSTPFTNGLSGMWGAADGTLFTFSNSSLGRLKNGAFETIARPSLDAAADYYYFTGVWGNSPNEVFLTLNDATYKQYECGTTFLIWFDGATFHPF